MIHRRRMMAAALAAIAIPCIAVGKHRRLQTVQCRRHEPRRNHRDPGGPIAGAGRAVTGDGMVSAGFGSGRNGGCRSVASCNFGTKTGFFRRNAVRSSGPSVSGGGGAIVTSATAAASAYRWPSSRCCDRCSPTS